MTLTSIIIDLHEHMAARRHPRQKTVAAKLSRWRTAKLDPGALSSISRSRLVRRPQALLTTLGSAAFSESLEPSRLTSTRESGTTEPWSGV